MLGRAAHQALRIHDGEDLPTEEGVPGGEHTSEESAPGGEYLPGWDDFPEDVEPISVYAGARPRSRLAARWRRQLRGAGVGVAVAIPAMLIAHALVARPSGPTGSRPALGERGAVAWGAGGGSMPTAAANASEPPEAVARRRASLPTPPPSATSREAPLHKHARTRGAGSVVPVGVAAASVAPSQVIGSVGEPIEQTSASARSEFGFER